MPSHKLCAHGRDLESYCPDCEQAATKECVEGDSVITQHPTRYSAASRDLYSLFIEKYSLPAWLRHVEMEMLQYVWRLQHEAGSKYLEDVEKIKVICERIIEEKSK